MFDKDTHFLSVFYHHKQTYCINVPFISGKATAASQCCNRDFFGGRGARLASVHLLLVN